MQKKIHSGYVIKVGPGYPIQVIFSKSLGWKKDQLKNSL